jgi:RNA polymerase sigma-54 factor
MRPGLQLKFSQQLTMTPQLQQAIKLLQLSTLELSQEITEQLYSNPLLEIEDSSTSDGNTITSETEVKQTASVDLSDENVALAKTASDASESSVTESEGDWQSDMSSELPVDANWEENFSAPIPVSSTADNSWEQVHQVTESLRDHLYWQLNLTPMSPRDQLIAVAIIDAVESSGLLSESVLDIVSHQSENYADDPLEEDEIMAVLHRLQQFDPPGIFARDIKECLLIQLHQLSPETDHINEAIELVTSHLEDIASVELNSLAKKTQIDAKDIQEALKLIRTLNPRPGESFSGNTAEYIAPDAYVEKIGDRWQVRLNDVNIPRLKINDLYSGLIKRADNSDQNQYLKDNLAEARWFLRSIESRNETLMRVAMTIVELQQGFLDNGPIAMKPMVLSDIAEKLELHESTISRVTTAKYLATPQGIFELKYFFSSHVSTAGGGECSSTAVCAILKTLIEAEKPSKPLSDNKLMALLEQQGIQVARRTVAKYRESLNIPSSSQRKRFENSA